MSEEKIDWKTSWKNPFEIVRLDIENHKLIFGLEAIKRKLKAEISEEKKIKKGGFIFEGERKQNLISEVNQLDSELAARIKDISTKNDVIPIFDKRIAEIRTILDNSKNELKKLLRNEDVIDNAANKIVDRYIEILIEIKDLYEKQIKNIELNKEYENKLLNTTRDELTMDIKKFIKEGEKTVERTKQNKLMEEKLHLLTKEAEGLRQEAEKVKHLFEEETEQIGIVKRALARFFPSLISTNGYKKEAAARDWQELQKKFAKFEPERESVKEFRQLNVKDWQEAKKGFDIIVTAKEEKKEKKTKEFAGVHL